MSDDPAPEETAASAPDRRRWGRWLLVALVSAILAPPLSVLTYRLLPPPPNLLMVNRLFAGDGLDYRWRGLSDISPNLVRAVIASEDARFCRHHGFDLEAIRKAQAHNKRRPNRLRGASTISQQAAKNVFLWPGRGWVRKGLEAGYTILLEALWGKRRIMEVYLNVAEFAPGVYGAEAAARRLFGKGADELTPREAARLAAVLPSPRRYSAEAPGPYVRRRARTIQAQMGTVRADGLDACVLR
ncbi:monofunctional biosynthetic peptidoglycan transglycosylase [Brevundimonas sp. 2R-24]|uniref:Biosynthetic peptidoglycan transglycosylase n=1 Tax=Peiella sedimenti TaxID=3061083 RepID=A0ABT8SKQ2_9CAUL|nr:monofunctional biosynthetic peptidoglycan transglycosylase [Caulobacteraceae bacterium XZ-24]